jgi:hypothetical protein
MDIHSNSGSENAKVCGEALQAAQKRVRLAFFLTMGASCIVLLIVINLWNSLLVHNGLVQGGDASSKSAYVEEYAKKIADQSFYQIPSLGIEITCDDIGLLGPVTLLVFSLYSFMTLRASHCHLNSVTDHRIAADPLIDALVEIETPPQDLLARRIFQIPRLLQFLPAVACCAVVAYWLKAHFAYHIQENPIDTVILTSRPMARFLDYIGVVFGALVLLANCASFKAAKDKEQTAKDANRSSGDAA